MQAALLGRERVDAHPRRLAAKRSLLGRRLRVGTHYFAWVKRNPERGSSFRHRRRRSGENPADDLPPRNDLGRLKLRGDGLRLALRHVEEARKDLVPVLLGEVLRQFDDRGETEPTIPERLDDLREFLEKLGGGLPVVGCAGGQTEVAGQEGEQRFAVEVDPSSLPVEVRECDEELGQRGALVAEEIGETGGQFECAGHARIVSRVFGPSGDARIRALAGDLEGGSAPPPAVLHGPRRASGHVRTSVPRRPRTRERRSTRNASTSHLGHVTFREQAARLPRAAAHNGEAGPRRDGSRARGRLGRSFSVVAPLPAAPSAPLRGLNGGDRR